MCYFRRSNVTRAFKELKPGRDASGQPTAPGGLPLCEGHELRAGEGRVRVEGPGEACLFEKAEEVQEQKVRLDAAKRQVLSSYGLVHATPGAFWSRNSPYHKNKLANCKLRVTAREGL